MQSRCQRRRARGSIGVLAVLGAVACNLILIGLKPPHASSRRQERATRAQKAGAYGCATNNRARAARVAASNTINSMPVYIENQDNVATTVKHQKPLPYLFVHQTARHPRI